MGEAAVTKKTQGMIPRVRQKFISSSNDSTEGSGLGLAVEQSVLWLEPPPLSPKQMIHSCHFPKRRKTDRVRKTQAHFILGT